MDLFCILSLFLSLSTFFQGIVGDTHVSSFLGTTTPGTVNGIGTNSQFNHPEGLDFVSNGNYLLVADTGSHQIRKVILSTQQVTSWAGSTSTGLLNGVGTNALFAAPTDVNVSPDETYALVPDYDAHNIRKIMISTIEVTLFAGSTTGTAGYANGIGTTAQFNSPERISISPDGSYALWETLPINKFVKYLYQLGK